MAINDLVQGSNLGNEFDIGGIAAGEIRLKIGSGLTRAADGTISVIVQPSISVTETGVCIDPGGGALRAFRVATYVNGLLQSEIYIDAADSNVTYPITTPIVDCCEV